MNNDPEKLTLLKQQFSSFWEGITSTVLSKKRTASKVTVCDLGRMRTVLLELEKRPGHLFVHHLDIIKNASRDQKPSLILKPFSLD